MLRVVTASLAALALAAPALATVYTDATGDLAPTFGGLNHLELEPGHGKRFPRGFRVAACGVEKGFELCAPNGRRCGVARFRQLRGSWIGEEIESILYNKDAGHSGRRLCRGTAKR